MSQTQPSNQNRNDKVVKDAIRIAHALNKHLLEDCEHCKRIFDDAFRYEDEETNNNKQNVGEPARVPTQPEPTPYRTTVDLI